MNNVIFEEIREEHLSHVLDIYNHYVLNTTNTFNTEPLTLNEIRNLVTSKNKRYKSFVISSEDIIAGYILITQYKTRQAYDFTAEITIYLKPEFVGQGIGKQSLKFIERIAKENGFHTLIAGLCTENDRSKYLFEGDGYLQCAHLKEVGYKFGRFLDVAFYQKMI
jgi:L-amino acid N-acyltransferase YncA